MNTINKRLVQINADIDSLDEEIGDLYVKIACKKGKKHMLAGERRVMVASQPKDPEATELLIIGSKMAQITPEQAEGLIAFLTPEPEEK